MPNIFQKQIPDYVLAVCKRLHDAQYQAYIVGGAIRDLALGLTPKDYDIATDATPDQVENLFTHTAPTGKRYGTITIILEDGNTLEVTTFRQDAPFSDGRRPDSVTYSQRLENDLARRDFTMNAIAYEPLHNRIVDPFKGLEDLKQQLLQTVGSAQERICEDALRMMRAVRIKAEKGLTMTDTLRKTIMQNTLLLQNVSNERIADELCRIITSEQPTVGVYDLMELGLLKMILPELQACVGVLQRQDYHIYDVFGHIAHSLQYTEPDLVLRLALLLHDIGKPPTTSIDKKGIIHFYGHDAVSAQMAVPILDRLKFSNRIKQDVIPLIRNHMRNVESDQALRKLMSELKTPEQARRFAQIRFADKMAGRRKHDELYKAYQATLGRIARVSATNIPLQVKDLPITGEDVMRKLAIPAGPAVGAILEHLLKMTLDKPELNSYDILLGLVPEIYAKKFARPPQD